MAKNRNRCVCTKTSYSIPIEGHQFAKLCDWLKTRNAGAPHYCEISNEMEAAVAGVHSIACSPEYGNCVHFDLDAKDDTARNRAKLIEVIDIYMGYANEPKIEPKL